MEQRWKEEKRSEKGLNNGCPKQVDGKMIDAVRLLAKCVAHFRDRGGLSANILGDRYSFPLMLLPTHTRTSHLVMAQVGEVLKLKGLHIPGIVKKKKKIIYEHKVYPHHARAKFENRRMIVITGHANLGILACAYICKLESEC